MTGHDSRLQVFDEAPGSHLGARLTRVPARRDFVRVRPRGSVAGVPCKETVTAASPRRLRLRVGCVSASAAATYLLSATCLLSASYLLSRLHRNLTFLRWSRGCEIRQLTVNLVFVSMQGPEATATPRLPPGPEFCGGSRAGSACVGESSARGSGGRPARRAGWREVEASPTNSSTCPICMDKAVNPHEGARDVATFWQAGVGGAGPRRVCTHSACWPCALTHFSYPYATCALHFLEPARRAPSAHRRSSG